MLGVFGQCDNITMVYTNTTNMINRTLIEYKGDNSVVVGIDYSNHL